MLRLALGARGGDGAAMNPRWLVPIWLASASFAQQPAQPGGAPSPAAVPAAVAVDAPASSSAGSPRRFAAPPVRGATTLDVGEATRAAVVRLLELQQGDAGDEWPYQGVYREDRNESPIGYRVGGTAIACLGLVAVPGLIEDDARRAAVERGLRFVVAMLDAPRMQEDFIGAYDVRGWGHVYALQCLLTLRDRQLVPPDLAAQVDAKTKWLVATLVASAIPETGGWNYSRPRGYRSPRNKASTFMTAPALQALFHAKARGHDVSERVVGEALDALERARAKPGGYAYGAPDESHAQREESTLSMMDKTPSAAARAAVCETTLLLAGRGDERRLARAVQLFFAHWDDLAVRKSQQGTHVPPYGIAPYYFMFGHVYCAQAIEHLRDPQQRDAMRTKLRALLAVAREDDGTWNDRQFERSAGYGTALALWALHLPDLPPPERWPATAGSAGKASVK